MRVTGACKVMLAADQRRVDYARVARKIKTACLSAAVDIDQTRVGSAADEPTREPREGAQLVTPVQRVGHKGAENSRERHHLVTGVRDAARSGRACSPRAAGRAGTTRPS